MYCPVLACGLPRGGVVLATPACVAAEPNAPLRSPVQGEMVDADAPATYRLPLVGLCDPAEEMRIAMRMDVRAAGRDGVS